MTREEKALIKASEEIKCDRLIIITWDFESEKNSGNKVIVYKPLWKWLMKM